MITGLRTAIDLGKAKDRYTQVLEMRPVTLWEDQRYKFIKGEL